MVRFDIDAAVFGMGVARRRLLEVDPQAQHALGLFPQAEKLLTLAKVKSHPFRAVTPKYRGPRIALPHR